MLFLLNAVALGWLALRLIFTVAGPVMFYRAGKLTANSFSQTLLEEGAAPIVALLVSCAVIQKYEVDVEYFGLVSLPIMYGVFYGVRKVSEKMRPEFAKEKQFVLNYHLGTEDGE